jgi:hypothetical protein
MTVFEQYNQFWKNKTLTAIKKTLPTGAYKNM